MRDRGEELGLEPVRPLQLRDLLLQRSATPRQALDHRVERPGQAADLVVRRHFHLGVEVAARNRISRGGEGGERSGDGAREHDRRQNGDHGEECGEEGGGGDGAALQDLERLARDANGDRPSPPARDDRRWRVELTRAWLGHEDRRLELPEVGTHRNRTGRRGGGRRRRRTGRRVPGRDEQQPVPVEEAGVAHTAARPGLVGQLAETVDAAGEDRGADLARELRARVATGLDQVLAEVLQAALRQDPALDDAHEDDERGGGEPEAGPKA